MSSLAIKVENLSKLYRLGQVGTGTLKHDLNRLWYSIRGKEDPYLKVGQSNDRTKKGESDFAWALKDINFEVKQGEALGIIGRNGAGKSTLLKILSKITSPTTGEININGRIASLLEVGTGFHPELTGRENIFMNGSILGMRKWEIQKKFDEIVDFAGVAAYIDTPVKRYSSGMIVRLGFAVAAHLEPEILVVDEVLAVGDAEFQKKCIGKMKDVSTNQGRTVLFVSHNMSAVQNLCDTALFLKNGQYVNMGSAKQIVREYLSERNNLSNYKEYPKFLKYVKIEQEGAKIVLRAAYKLDIPVDLPHLGFVVYNNEGTPVFASNPTLENLQLTTRSYTEGEIVVEIAAPKLIDGEYIVSIWFGDSKQNFIEDLDCLTLEISGMTTNKQYSQSIIGNVVPETKWMIS
jgi:lipopolysaccharide transport system ATP-binding protein